MRLRVAECVRRTWRLPLCSTLSLHSTTVSLASMLSPLENTPAQSQETLAASEEGTAPESEEIDERERSTEDLARRQKTKIDSQRADIFKLRRSKKKHERKYRGVKEQVTKLEHEIGKVFGAYKETLEKRNSRIRAMEDELARTKELLTARSTELIAARSFLSTADGRTEREVLDIVSDLNEHIRQVSAILAKAWEKLGSSGRFVIIKKNIDEFSHFYGPALVHQSLQGDPAAVNFLIRSCCCMLVTDITSGWRDDPGTELEILGSVYKRLSASGRCT